MGYKSLSLIGIFCFLFLLGQAQHLRVTGIVQDSVTGKLLPRANILIKGPAKVQFVTSDMEGFYQADLEIGKPYSLSVSYIGYHAQEKKINTSAGELQLNFRLRMKAEQLEDIVVTHRYQPIKVSKDTVSFRVDAFGTGTERKLKDILEKLPGIEVDESGGVRFQGKRVKMTTVESKSFFGGGSKLAIENIPADAVEEVQMIDNFHAVDFMKSFIQSDELAMNVTLKKNKKEFVFGDVELGAGPEKRYLGRNGIFYYSPKNSGGVISNFNNMGSSPLSRQEISLLDAGMETKMLERRRSLFNLEELGGGSEDVFSRRAALIVGNAHVELNKNVKVDAYLLNYNSKSKVSILERTNLFDGVQTLPELRETNNIEKNNLTVGNMRFELGASRYKRTFYAASFQDYEHNYEGSLFSETNTIGNNLSTLNKNKGQLFKQLFEQYRNFNVRQSSVLALNYIYEGATPNTTYHTKDHYFERLAPVLLDSIYLISSTRKQSGHNLIGSYRYYFLLNGKFQLNFIGESIVYYNVLRGTDGQQLSNGEFNNFESFGFGNDLKRWMFANSFGGELKMTLGNWISSLAVLPTFLNQRIVNTDLTTRNNKVLLKPQLVSEFKFQDGGKLKLGYTLSTRYPTIENLAPGAWLFSYNVIKQGNRDLFYELYHDTNLGYQFFKLESQTHFFTTINLQRRAKTIRQLVDYESVLQTQRQILSEIPEHSFSLISNYGRRFGAFRPSISTSLHTIQSYQTVNSIHRKVDQLFYTYTVGLRFSTKTRGGINVNYKYGESRLSGIRKSNLATNRLQTQLELNVNNNLAVKPIYSFLTTTFEGRSDRQLHSLDLTVHYRIKNSGWSALFNAVNMFDKGTRYQTRLGDYYRIERETSIIPRAMVVGIGYKL